MNKCLYLFTCLLLAAFSCRLIRADEPTKGTPAEAAYQLGPEDQISIHVVDLDDISDKPTRIDPNGYLDFPLIGRIHAGGLTVEQFRAVLSTHLAKYIDSPQITINVLDYRSQPVSILGEVNQPGLHQLQGPTHLVDVISLAGGLKPDAGQKLTITRQEKSGPLPVPLSRTDRSGRFSIATLRLSSLLDGSNPAENIEVRAHDVISISRTDQVYVVGQVKKAGGINLNSEETISITQALSLAEGTSPDAAPRKARILRAVDGKPSNKNEIPVNLSLVLAGKAPDLELHANDVLYIPDNVPASAMKRATEAAIQIATGVMIYRR